MSMKKVTSSTIIKPGQWACLESKLRDGICQEPQKVLRVSGKRVTFVNKHGEDAYCLLHTVAFVCDTEDEGKILAAVSKAQREALNAVRDKHAAMIDKLISDSNNQ